MTIKLYHGTLKKNLKNIMSEGLVPSAGWGGAGTEGVYLSQSIDGADYWAVFAFAIDRDIDMEYERIRNKAQKHIAILEISIPEDKIENLRADMEQAEDFHFEGDPTDWQASLEQMGDAMYDGTIPPSWIKIIQ